MSSKQKKSQGNILVTSASKKIPLMESLKTARAKIGDNIKIYAGDADESCIAQYFADAFWHMPLLENLTVEQLLKYCQKEEITMIIPTRDRELPFFAEYREILQENGISVHISDPRAIHLCLDKLLFYHELQKMGYPVIETRENALEIRTERYVVKDRFGSGSNHIGLNLALDDAIEHAKTLKNPVFQPFIEGHEYSVDSYISKQGNVKGVIVRKRELVINGESQITSTIRNQQLEDMAAKLFKELGLYGHVLMQVIIDNNGFFHIIEINPRFGGASTLSLAAGLDSFYWFILESTGNSVEEYPFVRCTKEQKLVRYPKDIIIVN